MVFGTADGLYQEGRRTQLLCDLHGEYLTRKGEQSRLKLDEKVLRSEAILGIEDADVLRGVCSYKRTEYIRFDSQTFRAVHPIEAERCRTERVPYVRRQIFLIKSY